MNESLEQLMNGTELIQLPMNPFVKETLDFGGAEAVAGGYNLVGTGIVSAATSNPWMLSLAGPVIEKAGFFGWEAIKAFKKDDRKYFERLKDGLKNGLGNLAVDILAHDSIYTAIMAYGVMNTEVSPVALSLVSFLAALPPAVAMKHYGGEMLHAALKKYTQIKGFSWEKYYESRFLIAAKDHDRIFEDVCDRFGLGELNESDYEDQYYSNKLPSFGNRIPVVRERKVNDNTGNEISFNNIEIAYTVPMKRSERNSELNYFYIAKEKARLQIDGETPKLGLLGRAIKEKGQKITFDRQVRYNDELRVALDRVDYGEGLAHLMELKTFNDTKLLCEAMEYVMREYKVRTTTRPKETLFRHAHDI